MDLVNRGQNVGVCGRGGARGERGVLPLCTGLLWRDLLHEQRSDPMVKPVHPPGS